MLVEQFHVLPRLQFLMKPLKIIFQVNIKKFPPISYDPRWLSLIKHIVYPQDEKLNILQFHSVNLSKHTKCILN